jgi:hypothetical protein
MRKTTRNEKIERRGGSLLAVASLALTLASVGCTTIRYPGNGEPAMTTPSYGQPNQSATPGSSSGTEGIPPMASAYTGVSRVDTDALATLAAEQAFRGRILGQVNPAGVQTTAPAQMSTGQFVPPAQLLNPQPTVNPSVSSPTGVEAITAGGSIAADEALFASATANTAVSSASTSTTMSGSMTAARATPMAASARTIAVTKSTPVRVVTNASGPAIVTNVPSTKGSMTASSAKP